MDINDLLEKKREKYAAAKEIRDRVYAESDGEWKGDDTAKFDELMADVETLSNDIERFAKLEAAERSLQAVDEPPERRTHPKLSPMGQPASRRAAAGVTEEERSMALTAWLAGGSMQAKSLMTDDHRQAAERCGIEIGQREINLRLPPRAPKSLAARDMEEWSRRFQTVGTTTEGGHAVPDDVMQALEQALLSFGGMREVSTILRTDSGSDMPIPQMDDTSNAGQIIAETVEQTIVDLTFSQLVLNSFKYSSMRVGMSVEFLQDNAINAAGRIGEILGERIGRITNTHFTTGSGTGQPNGVVTASTLGDTAATNAAITYDEIVDLKHSVDPAYRRRGGRFMFNDSTLAALKKIKIPQFSGDTAGQPLWRPGMAQAEPNTIDGDPYTVNQDMASIGTLAISMLYGDFSKYLIRDVRDITLVRLDERYAELGVVAFLAFSRHDGDLLDAGTNPVKHLVHPT